MGSLSDTAKNSMLNNALRNTASALAGVVYVKMHTGDPGSSGTSNAATETTRAVVTMGAAASGASASTTTVTWTNVSTTESITWVSLWDAISGGNFLGRDDLAATKSLTAGDTATIAIGAITVTI